MVESFDATPIEISRASIPRALERATRYRLLNDPEQAESICLDVLAVDPGNQDALVMLVLALTDQFGVSDSPPAVSEVRDYVSRIASEYQRRYYTGIICERRARSFLRGPMGRGGAFELLREAMQWFERAAEIRPDDDDEALLRWNACLRTIRRHHLQPRAAEPEPQLE